MKIRRLSVCSAVACALACSGQDQRESVPGGASDAAASPAAPRPKIAAAPPAPKLQVELSAEGLDDMIGFAEKFANTAQPEEPLDFHAELQTGLAQAGLGPGFYEGLDFSGRWALNLRVPIPEPGQAAPPPSEVELLGGIPSAVARRLVDALPDTNRARDLGGGLWQIDGEPSIVLRETPTHLQFGRVPPDLDAAGELIAKQRGPQRVQARVSGIPEEWVDVEQAFGEAPPPLVPLADAIRSTTAAEGYIDWGSDRDMSMSLAAEGSFGALGLDPLGPPATGASDVAAALPGEAFVVGQMPWGDPALLHKLIDRNVDPEQIPAPFNLVVADAISGVRGLLDQLRGEIIGAAYLNSKGQANLVLAAAVADDASAREASRAILSSAEKAISAYIALQGGDKDKKFTVKLATGQKLGKARADRLTVTVPPMLQADVAGAAMLLGAKKPKLEVFVLVDKGIAIMSIGPGAKQVTSDIAKKLGRKRPSSLESDGGLALARSIDQGCQFCLAVDPKRSARAYFTAMRDGAEGNEEKAMAKDALKQLAGLDVDGYAALAVAIQPKRASVGVALRRPMIERNPADVRALMDLVDEVSAAAPLPEAAPGTWGALAPKK